MPATYVTGSKIMSGDAGLGVRQVNIHVAGICTWTVPGAALESPGRVWNAPSQRSATSRASGAANGN